MKKKMVLALGILGISSLGVPVTGLAAGSKIHLLQ